MYNIQFIMEKFNIKHILITGLKVLNWVEL